MSRAPQKHEARFMRVLIVADGSRTGLALADDAARVLRNMMDSAYPHLPYRSHHPVVRYEPTGGVLDRLVNAGQEKIEGGYLEKDGTRRIPSVIIHAFSGDLAFREFQKFTSSVSEVRSDFEFEVRRPKRAKAKSSAKSKSRKKG